MFDPVHAVNHAVLEDVDELMDVIAPLAHHINIRDLKQELPIYLSSAVNVNLNRDDVSAFSDGVLKFWRGASVKHLSTWRKAARIIFSISPNSASCERVFSLLSSMYGDTQASVLADKLQASLMLRYNERNIMHT